MRRFLSAVAYCLVALAPTESLWAQTIPVRVDFQNTQPKYIKNPDGSFGGLCLELMALIEGRSSFKFVYSKDFATGQRITANLVSGETHAHFGLGITAEREAVMTFAEPLYELSYVAIANAADRVDVRSLDDIKKLGNDGVVVTVFGTTVKQKLLKYGLTVDEGGRTPPMNFDKLIAGRGRFFVYHDLGTFYGMNAPEYKGKFRVLPVTIESYEQWLVLSKKAPAQLVEGLPRVIRELKASGAWGRVTAKYLKS